MKRYAIVFPLFLSAMTFLVFVVSIAYATVHYDAFVMSWAHSAAFAVSLCWYYRELHRVMSRKN